MKPIVLLTTALIVAAAGAPVLAEGGQGGQGGRLAPLDANKDGAIDRSEAAKAPKLLEHFDRLDANKDGRISAEERPQRGRHGGKGGRMAGLDTNKDGAIDRSEAAKAPKLLEHFDRLDANKDGRISGEEHPKRGRHGGKGARMAQLDTNKDGAIDRSEAAKAPKLLEHFDRLDANKDDRISAEERPQRGRHGGRRGGARLDTDGDKRVSRQEASVRPQLAERFTAIDDNNDGYLTREEFQAYRQDHPRQPQAPIKR
ncbi:MAG: calcium-binding protein [Xanthomonadaceae bacterium]|nr:calcium-binding protein [Xanthomonadaceae bacterium]